MILIFRKEEKKSEELKALTILKWRVRSVVGSLVPGSSRLLPVLAILW